jgi:Na+/proline symporter
MKLQFIDLAILLFYAAFMVGIGYWLKDRMRTSEDFLTAAIHCPHGSQDCRSWRQI